MARNVTYNELLARLEEVCDIENDAHVGPTEKRRALNTALAETWDVITSSGEASNYVQSVTFNTTSGQTEYAFGTIVPAGNMYRIHNLYVQEDGRLRPLRRLQPSEVHVLKPPDTSNVTLKLYYIPSCPQPDPTNTGTWGATVFDGINGWEEHAVLGAACLIKFKKDDDYNNFYRRKKEIESRINMMGQTDFGEPIRVSRKRGNRNDPFFLFRSRVNAYVVRGNKLELYRYEGYVV